MTSVQPCSNAPSASPPSPRPPRASYRPVVRVVAAWVLLWVVPALALFVVADGFGGWTDGARVSSGRFFVLLVGPPAVTGAVLGFVDVALGRTVTRAAGGRRAVVRATATMAVAVYVSLCLHLALHGMIRPSVLPLLAVVLVAAPPVLVAGWRYRRLSSRARLGGVAG